MALGRARLLAILEVSKEFIQRFLQFWRIEASYFCVAIEHQLTVRTT